LALLFPSYTGIEWLLCLPRCAGIPAETRAV
jgi:hypothetical protein